MMKFDENSMKVAEICEPVLLTLPPL